MNVKKKVESGREPWSEERILATAKEVLDIELEGIEKVKRELGTPFFNLVEKCLETLDHGGKLVLTGIGKSGHIGRKLSATLASTGSASFFLYPVEGMHGDLGMLEPGDLLLALSYSGETDELLAILPAAKRIGTPVVAITGTNDSRLAQWSDLTVPMPVPREACPFNLAPTTTTTALLALGDALAITLLKARGFRKEDYALIHPAGAIGRSITLRVTDIMRTGERFPMVRPETLVREAIVAMTRGRAGSVAVTNDAGILVGIFTDGDLRRHIVEQPNLMEMAVGDVMTANPVTLRDDAMAIEIMKILERRKIDDLIVVDAAGHPVGLIDIQDLPRFKVM